MKTLALFALLLILVCLYQMVAFAGWVQTSAPYGDSIKCFAMNPVPGSTSATNIFAGGIGGVFLSTNNGTNWTPVNSGLTNTDVRALAVMGTNLFAGGSSGIFLSTNNGTSWGSIGLNNQYISSLAFIGTYIFAGTAEVGLYPPTVFLSTNSGTSWTATNSGLVEVSAFAVEDQNVFAVSGGGVYQYDNPGWILSGPMNGGGVVALSVMGTNLVAGTSGNGVFLSNDTGWTAANEGLPRSTSDTTRFASVQCFASSGQDLFAGTDNGVFLSTNGGTTWAGINAGLSNINIRSLALSSDGAGGTNLFASTGGAGVWRRPLSEIVTGMKDVSGITAPDRFTLAQNYPNPFNPTTVVSFQLPEASNVRLVVYDILGREVSVLVNERKAAGSYSVRFDAHGMASGMYLYRLQAGNFVQTRKLLLLK